MRKTFLHWLNLGWTCVNIALHAIGATTVSPWHLMPVFFLGWDNDLLWPLTLLVLGLLVLVRTELLFFPGISPVELHSSLSFSSYSEQTTGFTSQIHEKSRWDTAYFSPSKIWDVNILKWRELASLYVWLDLSSSLNHDGKVSYDLLL